MGWKHRNRPELLGEKYERLTIIDFVHKNRQWYWKMKCDCGNIVVVHPGNVMRGATCSCGCLSKENAKKRLTKHGDAGKERLYRIWKLMKARCNRINGPDYPDYGGRGICVCDEWNEYPAFRAWAMSNGYADNLTIERKDVNGNYFPENCTWITNERQARNRRSTKWVEYNGRKVSLAEACESSGMPESAIRQRIKRGMDVDGAFSKPIVANDETLAYKAKLAGLNYHTVVSRIKQFGWSEEEALSVPSKRTKSSKNALLSSYNA